MFNAAKIEADAAVAIADVLPYFIVDMRNGTILHATRAAEEAFGYFVRHETIGKNVDQLVPVNARERHQYNREVVFANDPRPRPMGVRESVNGLKKNGEEFPVIVALYAITLYEIPCVIAVVIGLPKTKSE